VPFILIGGNNNCSLRSGGGLGDIAPTMLQILGIPQPIDMTGASLLKKQRKI
jgi:2,3-bisphosphoglycerate-independent phosphoglycerate mutase